jgi:hypothetical protein
MEQRPKRPTHLNLLAKAVDQATGNAPPALPIKQQKNPAAVELGRLGGLKGGKARASKLTPEQRKAIAQKGAAARWQKRK